MNLASSKRRRRSSFTNDVVRFSASNKRNSVDPERRIEEKAADLITNPYDVISLNKYARCFICTTFYPTLSCEMVSPYADETIAAFARDYLKAKNAQILRQSIQQYCAGACCGCCKCNSCIARVATYNGRLRSSTTVLAPPPANYEETGNESMFEYANEQSTFEMPNFEYMNLHDEDSYLLKTAGNCSGLNYINERVKVDTFVEGHFLSVCVPAAVYGDQRIITTEWQPLEFVRASDEYFHSVLILRDCKSACLPHESKDVGICNCRFQQTHSSHFRPVFEHILDYLYANISKISWRDFDVFVLDQLHSLHGSNDMFSSLSSGLECLQCVHTKAIIRGIQQNEWLINTGNQRPEFPALLERAMSFSLEGWLAAINKKFNNNIYHPQFVKLQETLREYDQPSNEINSLKLCLPNIMMLSSKDSRVGGDIQTHCEKGAVLAVRCHDDQLFQDGAELKSRFRFHTVVRQSNRGKITCDECGTHRTYCEHKVMITNAYDANEDETAEDDTVGNAHPRPERRFDMSAIIPVMLSRSSPFSDNHDEIPIRDTARMKIENMPNELSPFSQLHSGIVDASPKCLCKRGCYLPSGFCPCQVKCKVCGSAWDPTPENDGNAIVYLTTGCKKVRLKYFKCSNSQCTNTRRYNGHGDGLIVLYTNADGDKVIINAYCMIVIAEDIYGNSLTISNHHAKIAGEYRWGTSAGAMMPRQAFVASFLHVLKVMMIPFQPMTMACENCGLNPRGVIFDGTAIRTRLSRALSHYMRTYWNHFDLHQNGIIHCRDDGSILVNDSTTYAELTILQGKLQEGVIKWVSASQITTPNGFRRGCWKRGGDNGPWQDFTRQQYDDIVQMLAEKAEGNRGSDNARSIYFLIRGVSSNDSLLISDQDSAFLDVQQSLIGCKNVTKIQSPFGGGALLYSYIGLALGLPATACVPSLFFKLKSYEEIELVYSKYLHQHGESYPRRTQASVTDCIEKFKNVIQCSFQKTFEFYCEAKVRPHSNALESNRHFCERICGSIIGQFAEIIDKQLHMDEELFQIFRNDNHHELGWNIAQILDVTFPPLREYLMNQKSVAVTGDPLYSLPEACRPQFSYLAKLVAGIWFKGVKFHVFRDNKKTGEILQLTNLPNNEILRDVLEQSETVPLGDGSPQSAFTTDLRSGWYCFNSKMRVCKQRSKYPLADKQHRTNSSRALEDHGNDFNAAFDELGHCKKSFPVSSKHTSGFFLIMCTCPKRCVLLIGDMDRGESSRFPRDALINRFPVAPKYIFYDNGCSFHLYCMARDPIYFFATVFLIDSLHYCNHVTICSCSYHREYYKTYEGIGDVNSSACEQLFSQMDATVTTVIQQMSPENAILYLAAFCLQYNAKKNG